jgi:hypothetical protein
MSAEMRKRNQQKRLYNSRMEDIVSLGIDPGYIRLPQSKIIMY